MQKISSLTAAARIFVTLLGASAWAQQYTISTLAGNGTAGFSGDNGNAMAAELSGPSGVAADASGKVYIVDAGNNRIRMVANGNITTIAGTGDIGYASDGTAASVQFYGAARITVDASGNIYISDSGNDVIREITPDGKITTIAGISCTQDLITGCGPGYMGDGGPATAALLSNPLGMTTDSAGNLYIAEADNNLIRKVSGGNISTVSVLLRMNHPADVAIDPAHNLYIADTNNDRIVKLSAAGIPSIFAGGSDGFGGDNGPAASAKLSSPVAVAVDGAGNVYIADTFNSRIRKVAANGTITTIAGNGQPNYSGDGGSAVNAELYFPRAIAVAPWGGVYVADSGNNRVRLLTPPPPVIAANGVVNAASFAPHISPGALATVFGNYFGAWNTGAGVPLPTSVNSVQVSVAGRSAPLLYVTPTQVNFQVPWETTPGAADIIVTVNGAVSNTLTVPVAAAGPGLFTGASGAAVVQNADYSVNSPDNPAAPSSAIVAYLTGTGPVNGTVADGSPAPTTSVVQATSQVTATIGPQSAQVLFAGLAPGFVGLAQANIVVPAGIAAGNYPLVVTINGEASNAGTVSVGSH